MKKMYASESKVLNRRGKPVVRWKDWVKEYLHVRGSDRGGGLIQGRKECM